LADDGADLVLTDILPTGIRAAEAKPSTGWGGLGAVAQEVRNKGRRTVTALADVRAADQIQAAVACALETFGRIDILVNNAAAPAGADRVPVVQLSEDAWDVVLDTNLKGSFLCAKTVAATMLQRGVHGRIINISSTAGRRGAANFAAYCASKFGVLGFTQALAMELALSGITVNAICPGAADTDRIDYLGRTPAGGFDPAQRMERMNAEAARIPVGRMATAQDIAEVVAFIASDAARHVTGQAINVDGGTVMN
jgi:NAD(P)-dependent dehydrogenase (short-subunit alcohol dehydrogenase family)